jgi:hypothetical protein
MPKIFEYLGILIFFYSNEHVNMSRFMFMASMIALKVRQSFI